MIWKTCSQIQLQLPEYQILLCFHHQLCSVCFTHNKALYLNWPCIIIQEINFMSICSALDSASAIHTYSSFPGQYVNVKQFSNDFSTCVCSCGDNAFNSFWKSQQWSAISVDNEFCPMNMMMNYLKPYQDQ